MPDLRPLLSRHRPEVLRHCYRMIGSYADAEDLTQDALLAAWEAQARSGDEGSSFRSWILTLATRACLDALASRRRLELPQLEYPASMPGAPLEELESSRWLTPAPDARLFPEGEAAAERRESVALGFLAALQRLPARQRAALLLEDVGLGVEEIARALELTSQDVNGLLLRAREGLTGLPGATPTAPEEPPPEVLAAYARAWEDRDLDGLTALLREDVLLAMPPRATWFRGRDAVVQVLRSPRFQAFWAAGVRVGLTRANGLPALSFFSGRDDGHLHSVGVTRFQAGRVAEVTVFIGPAFLAGFDHLGTTAQDPDPDA